MGFFAILLVEEVALHGTTTEPATKEQFRSMVDSEKKRLKEARKRDRIERMRRGDEVNSPLGSPKVSDREVMRIYDQLRSQEVDMIYLYLLSVFILIYVILLKILL